MVKFALGADLRRVRLEPNLSFEAVQSAALDAFGHDLLGTAGFSLKYIDDERDSCELTASTCSDFLALHGDRPIIHLEVVPHGGAMLQRAKSDSVVAAACSRRAKGDDKMDTGAALDLVRHEGVTCDGCEASPIIGPRFRCTHCQDFDLCGACYDHRSVLHPPCHDFTCYQLPIKRSSRKARHGSSAHNRRPLPALHEQESASGRPPMTREQYKKRLGHLEARYKRHREELKRKFKATAKALKAKWKRARALKKVAKEAKAQNKRARKHGRSAAAADGLPPAPATYAAEAAAENPVPSDVAAGEPLPPSMPAPADGGPASMSM